MIIRLALTLQFSKFIRNREEQWELFNELIDSLCDGCDKDYYPKRHSHWNFDNDYDDCESNGENGYHDHLDDDDWYEFHDNDYGHDDDDCEGLW